jgi:hypothetical protein
MYDTQYLLKLADVYCRACSQDLVKIAKITQLPNGQYRDLSMKGKNLGTYNSHKAAQNRLKQVEYFKHKDELNSDDSKKIIDLTGAIDFSYSAIMREMRQKASKEQVKDFLVLFKKEFDKAVKIKLQKPEKIALQNSLIKFNKKHAIKVKKKLVKNAAVSELGDPAQVGKYLANIVRFTLNRISPEKRSKAIESLRRKFYAFNANEIAQKKLPSTSAQ